MSVPAITFDPARELDLFFRIGRDGARILVFLNPDGSPYDITSKTFAAVVKQTEKISSTVLSLTLTKPDINKLQIAVNAAGTANIRPKRYYWEMTVGAVKTWFTGGCTFHNGKFDGVSPETVTITVNDAAEVITITVSDSSAPAEGTWIWRAPWDASVGTYPVIGGTGTSGAIKKGNVFPISVEGTMGGVLYPAGTAAVAKEDSPGQDSTKWYALL